MSQRNFESGDRLCAQVCGHPAAPGGAHLSFKVHSQSAITFRHVAPFMPIILSYFTPKSLVSNDHSSSVDTMMPLSKCSL